MIFGHQSRPNFSWCVERFRHPAKVNRHAEWLYFRSTLSLRDVQVLLAERGSSQLRDDPLLGRQGWAFVMGPRLSF